MDVSRIWRALLKLLHHSQRNVLTLWIFHFSSHNLCLFCIIIFLYKPQMYNKRSLLKTETWTLQQHIIIIIIIIIKI